MSAEDPSACVSNDQGKSSSLLYSYALKGLRKDLYISAKDEKASRKWSVTFEPNTFPWVYGTTIGNNEAWTLIDEIYESEHDVDSTGNVTGHFPLTPPADPKQNVLVTLEVKIPYSSPKNITLVLTPRLSWKHTAEQRFLELTTEIEGLSRQIEELKATCVELQTRPDVSRQSKEPTRHTDKDDTESSKKQQDDMTSVSVQPCNMQHLRLELYGATTYPAFSKWYTWGAWETASVPATYGLKSRFAMNDSVTVVQNGFYFLLCILQAEENVAVRGAELQLRIDEKQIYQVHPDVSTHGKCFVLTYKAWVEKDSVLRLCQSMYAYFKCKSIYWSITKID